MRIDFEKVLSDNNLKIGDIIVTHNPLINEYTRLKIIKKGKKYYLVVLNDVGGLASIGTLFNTDWDIEKETN